MIGRLLKDLLSRPATGHTAGDTADKTARLRDLYLDLLQDCLLGLIYEDPGLTPTGERYDAQLRELGRDWPSQAHTMIGSRRMKNLRTLVEQVLHDVIPGDFIETGVWRGGACIYMRGILHAFNEQGRCVWVADSFAGLPPPDSERYPADAGDRHYTIKQLAIPLETVKANFAKYGLLDDQVRFVPGWFKDTLSTAPIGQLALMRLDGDMYQSTMEALTALYARLSPGGFVIIDDYEAAACRKAVEDFRGSVGANEQIHPIDRTGVFWRKSR
jgi:macrocin-O-methyltransferase TylF-like protien